MRKGGIIFMLKINRIGETRKMNCGLDATIIGYRKYSDIDVKFENNHVVCHRQYVDFEKGEIKCPMIINYHGDYAEVINPNTKKHTKFLIDIDDIYLIKDKWCNIDGGGYVAFGESKTKKIKLHRVIMNAPDDVEVDHRDGNKLDIRKKNLRICCIAENSKNLSKRSDNTSGYKGVSWNKNGKKWKSSLNSNGKVIYLGLFNTKEEAAKAYNEAAIKHHGEFARLNIINE